VPSLFPRFVTKRYSFFNLLKKMKLLKKHGHFYGMENESYGYFNIFNWGELVALFRRAKSFAGNDGGVMHLAAVCGAKGYAIFGPSSVKKNKPINAAIEPVSRDFDCQPCQFKVGGNIMSSYSITCPYQLRCLYSISAAEIADKIKAIG
jgi:ADP-heptose:LPS heptosyltransferase